MHVHSSLQPARTCWIMFHLPDKQIKHVGTTPCVLFIVDQNLCITEGDYPGYNESLVLNKFLKKYFKKDIIRCPCASQLFDLYFLNLCCLS